VENVRGTGLRLAPPWRFFAFFCTFCPLALRRFYRRFRSTKVPIAVKRSDIQSCLSRGANMGQLLFLLFACVVVECSENPLLLALMGTPVRRVDRTVAANPVIRVPVSSRRTPETADHSRAGINDCRSLTVPGFARINVQSNGPVRSVGLLRWNHAGRYPP